MAGNVGQARAMLWLCVAFTVWSESIIPGAPCKLLVRIDGLPAGE